MSTDRICEVPLAAITVDPSLQPRCDGVNEAHVKALMESAETWPPVVLFRRGDELILGDGAHRVEAKRQLGGKGILAIVLDPPSDSDFARAAFELNIRHGRALTLADRKLYARRVAREYPDLSDREIGRRAYLNHETVRTLRTIRLDVHPQLRKPGEIDGDVVSSTRSAEHEGRRGLRRRSPPILSDLRSLLRIRTRTTTGAGSRVGATILDRSPRLALRRWVPSAQRSF